jgi:hypothetical protein
MKHPHQSGRSGAAVIARNLDASRIFELKSELKITRIEEFKDRPAPPGWNCAGVARARSRSPFEIQLRNQVRKYRKQSKESEQIP